MDSLTSDPDARVCGVCGRVLDHVTFPDGSRPNFWRHTQADQPEDHQPVPVLPGEVPTRGRCDFCQAEDPTWVLPARDFDLVGLPTGSKGDWAACDTCANLISMDRWNALLARAVASWEERHGKDSIAPVFMGRLYRTLRKNITGAIRPLEENR